MIWMLWILLIGAALEEVFPRPPSTIGSETSSADRPAPHGFGSCMGGTRAINHEAVIAVLRRAKA